MHNDVLLGTENLQSGYGGKRVLQGLNLQVRRGEIAAVIGRNGVGKSTLMKTIIGLVPAIEGSVVYRGRCINSVTSFRRARMGIGYVPQGRDMFPRMTVLESLAVGCFAQKAGTAAASVDHVFGYFPILRERSRQLAGTLSGGQQQQLAIGRVLVSNPDLILLDEPSEGIQPNIVQNIARIMVELNQQFGLTVVLVEQNVDMIRAMAQRCYVVDKGRVVAELGRDALADNDAMRRHLAI